MELKKPKYCGQDWLEMKKNPQGRTCGSCQKNIYDFSSKSWQEIEAIQKENNYLACGMYSAKQLAVLGIEQGNTRSCNSFASFSALLMGLGLSLTEPAEAQEPAPVNQTHSISSNVYLHHPPSDSSAKSIIKGMLYTMEEGKKTPLAFAQVYVKELKKGAVSDGDGNFILEVPVPLDTTINDTLIVSYVGYKTKKLPLTLRANGSTSLEIELTYNPIDIGAAFYVPKPSLWQKIKWRFLKLFR